MKLFRPTENTKFRIDYAWFEQQGQDVNVLIRKVLTPEQQERLGESTVLVAHDYVDDATGEVHAEDQVIRMIRTESAKDPGFITPRTPVVEAAFRLFLLNSNQPLTPVEMAEIIKRRPQEILAQLGGRVVHYGVRPVHD